MRRQAVALLAVGTLLLAGGCLGLALGETLEMESESAAVSDDALAETGFTHADTQTEAFEETVEVSGVERDVRAEATVVTYERPLEADFVDDETGAFVVASAPDFEMLGRSANPITEMENEELVEEFRSELESEIGEIRDVRHVDERTEPVLGYAATVDTFAADADFAGEERTVNVHVTSIVHEDDLIVALGVHPEALQQQAPEIHALVRGIEHPADV